jgi:hypothetical protein
MNPRRFPTLCGVVVTALLLFHSRPILYAQSDAVKPTEPQAELAAQGGEAVEEMAPAAAEAATELLVFDVNRLVTTDDRGFPRNDPPMPEANGNWYSPVNFVEGTFYYRVEIRSQPRPQEMRLQFCIWQYSFRLENCGSQQPVSGTAGTVVTWEQGVQNLWMKDGNLIDWKNPRQRYGVAIKNSQKKPVSNYNGWNWNGENPSHWYPLDMRFTVVVVAQGATFGGWAKYIDAAGADPPPPDPTPEDPVPDDPVPDEGADDDGVPAEELVVFQFLPFVNKP